MDELTRLLARIERGEDCWLWTGATNDQGYGQVRRKRDGRSVIIYVHRLMYELLVGPIPPGLTIDHDCHNDDQSCPGGEACLHRRCTRPDHLTPRPLGENTLRGGRSVVSRHYGKTHCDSGHEFTPENTRMRASGRICITCARAWSRKANAKYRAKLARGVPNRAKTHCPQGHPYDEAYGRRICRECRRKANREYMRRRYWRRKQGG